MRSVQDWSWLRISGLSDVNRGFEKLRRSRRALLKAMMMMTAFEDEDVLVIEAKTLLVEILSFSKFAATFVGLRENQADLDSISGIETFA